MARVSPESPSRDRNPGSRGGIRIAMAFRSSVLVASLVAAPAIAETLVTESAFLSSLTDSHPAMIALGDEVAGARGDARSVGLLPNPSVALEHEGPDEAAAQTTISFGWRPPLDGRRGAARSAANARLDAAVARRGRAALELRASFREIYARWSAAAERVALLGSHHEQVSELAGRLRRRVAKGESAGLSARRMELAAAEARAALAAAEASLARARAEVGVRATALPGDAVPVLPRLPEPPGTLDGGDRADVEAARSELEAALAAERLAGRVFTFPSLEVGWTRIDDRGEVDEGPTFGLSVEVPLFDRAQGDRARAAARRTVAEARLTVLERRITAERSAAHDAYASLRDGVVEVRQAVAAAPAMMDAAWASFSAGELGLADLLETVRSVHGSELAELELRELALAAHRELELAMGRPLTTGGGR